MSLLSINLSVNTLRYVYNDISLRQNNNFKNLKNKKYKHYDKVK